MDNQLHRYVQAVSHLDRLDEESLQSVRPKRVAHDHARSELLHALLLEVHGNREIDAIKLANRRRGDDGVEGTVYISAGQNLGYNTVTVELFIRAYDRVTAKQMRDVAAVEAVKKARVTPPTSLEILDLCLKANLKFDPEVQVERPFVQVKEHAPRLSRARGGKAVVVRDCWPAIQPMVDRYLETKVALDAAQAQRVSDAAIIGQQRAALVAPSVAQVEHAQAARQQALKRDAPWAREQTHTAKVVKKAGRRNRVTFAALTGKKRQIVLAKILPGAIDSRVYGEGVDYERLLTPEIRERLKVQFIKHTEAFRDEGVNPSTGVAVCKARTKKAAA